MIPNNEELRKQILAFITNGGSYYQISKRSGIKNLTSIKHFAEDKKDFHGKTYERIYKAIQ
jgi:hypothetical protein